MKIEVRLEDTLERAGLRTLGWFLTEAGDFDRQQDREMAGRSALLIANVGGELWPIFRASAEFADRQSDPLNRWTSRTIDEIANKYGAIALYPFGKPIRPFQRWAMRASGIQPSPLGILIHPRYGLWLGFRAVLVFSDAEPPVRRPKSAHPCMTCAEKPCLTACPVHAFSELGYDVPACRQWIAGGSEPVCATLGCRARDACPIGTNHRYIQEQIGFHMDAFVG